MHIEGLLRGLFKVTEGLSGISAWATLLRDDSEVIQATSYSGVIQGWLSVKGSALSKQNQETACSW